MLYDAYQQKINKIARFFSFVRKNALKLCLAFVAIGALVTVLCVTKGMTSDVICKDVYVYGDKIVFKADSFLSDVHFEFKTSTGNWSNTYPTMPGEYTVRAVGKSIGGENCYGKEKQFSIVKKPILVTLVDDKLTYGEQPSIVADLAIGDRIECSEFIYDDILAKNTGVEPVATSICVLDAYGNDVTSAYTISTQKKDVVVRQRSLTVTVADSSKIYDGMDFTFDQYEISSGSLANGDMLVATFSASLNDVGSVLNEPALQVINQDNVDVTHQYHINEQIGMLTVEKRPLIVRSEDMEWLYDGQAHSHAVVEISDDTPLVDTHQLKIDNTTVIKTAGVYDNWMRLSILNESGENETNNYSLFFEKGRLEIIQKDVTLKTQSQSWMYDAKTHRNDVIEVDGYLDGHSVMIVSSASLIDCGTEENIVEIVILDNTGLDVTKNYNILTDYGVLTIEKRPIKFTPKSDSHVYNAQPFSCVEYEILSDVDLVKSHTISVLECTQLTSVGSVRNCFTKFCILDMYGNDRTDNYEVVQVNENYITVEKREIILKPEDMRKYYNATQITASEVIVHSSSKYDLVEGHWLDFVIEGGCIDVTAVAEASEIVQLTIYDEESADVTSNYGVVLLKGKIEIIKRPILIKVNNTEKIYDGIALTGDSCYEVLPVSPLTKAIAGNDELNVTFTGSVVDVGSVNVKLKSYNIYNSERNKDVTANYDVQFESGKLTILPRPIMVQSGSAQKLYDGKPLVCHDPIKVVSGSLVTGHKLSMEATGTITNIGSVANSIKGNIVTSDNKVVTKNYEITLAEGTLTVYDENSAGGSNSGNSGSIDISGQLNNGANDITHKTVLRIKSGYSNVIYLKLMSYGDYTGTAWKMATEYPLLLDGKYSYNYLAGLAMDNSDVAKTTLLVQSFVNQYYLPYHLVASSVGYDVQTSDVVYSGNDTEYSVPYYVYTGIGSELRGLNSKYADEELAYREFVYNNYLTLDSDTRAFMDSLISQNGWSASDPQIYSKVVKYLQSSGKFTYNLEYDKAMDAESNIVTAFLGKYKEGICVHFASSATLLFRSLGIPARYVIGYAGETVADQWTEIQTPGHAWVEVYINGIGWMPMEVTAAGEGSGVPSGGEGFGSSGGQTQTDDRPILQISPAYQSKVHDGLPLIAKNLLEGSVELNELLDRGYSYRVEVEGSQTDVGIGQSTIIDFVLYDPTGKDVTKDYNVKYQSGTLEVFVDEANIIEIYLYRLQKVYDGKPLQYGSSDYKIIKISENTTLELTLNISLTDVGYLSLSDINRNIDYYIQYTVYREGVDITGSCKLLCVSDDGYGDSYIPIQINKRTLEITANSMSKVYDGEALECTDVTITKGSLINGHSIGDIEIVGNILSVGSTECFIIPNSVVLINDIGVDITGNYSISVKSGSLTVLPDPNVN